MLFVTTLVKNPSDFLSLLFQSFNLSFILPLTVFIGLINLSIVPKLTKDAMFNIF